jgi:hypothetical protein
VERILKNIREVTKGQFIAYDGNFFYLDLEKTTDYDAEVDARIAPGDRTATRWRAPSGPLPRRNWVSAQKALEPGQSVYPTPPPGLTAIATAKGCW